MGELTAFGVLIDERRAEMGMTWVEFCAAAPVSESALRYMRLGLYSDGPRPSVARRTCEWLGLSAEELRALIKDAGHEKPTGADVGTAGRIFRSDLPMTAWGDLIEDKREREGIAFEELEIAGVSPWTIRRHSKWPPSHPLKAKYARGIADFLGITEEKVQELHATPGRNAPRPASVEASWEYPIETWVGIKKRPAIETWGSCEGCEAYVECRADVLAGDFAHCERLLDLDRAGLKLPPGTLRSS